MSEKKIAVIVNPASGAGLGKRLVTELRSSAPALETFEIAVLRDLDLNSYSHVLVCGGDGTFTSVISRAVASNSSSTIVPIPLGTANDLARELGIPRATYVGYVYSVVDKLDRLVNHSISVWEARWGSAPEQSLAFTNYLSLGFDAEVVRGFSKWRADRSGKPSSVLRNRFQYALSGMKTLSYRLPPLTIRSKDSACTLSGGFSLLFANIQSIMGFGRTHEACDFSDNLLEAISLPSPVSFLKLMPVVGSILGSAELIGRKDFWQVSGELRGVALQADGEIVLADDIEELTIRKLGQVRVAGTRKQRANEQR